MFPVLLCHPLPLHSAFELLFWLSAAKIIFKVSLCVHLSARLLLDWPGWAHTPSLPEQKESTVRGPHYAPEGLVKDTPKSCWCLGGPGWELLVLKFKAVHRVAAIETWVYLSLWPQNVAHLALMEKVSSKVGCKAKLCKCNSTSPPNNCYYKIKEMVSVTRKEKKLFYVFSTSYDLN